MQQAQANNVDILYLSAIWGRYPDQKTVKALHTSVYDEIKECIKFGRNEKGMVIIAPSGNDKNTQPRTDHTFPSALGASTPQDKVKILGDGANEGSDWSSTQPPMLDVIAPGTCIWGADLKGSNGHNTGDFYKGSGTSAAGPIVAGIAALILEKNPSLTYLEVHDIIRQSAEKIGGYNYNVDPNRPGWSKEAGYGRVNAYKAVQVLTSAVGIYELESDHTTIKVLNPIFHNIVLWVEEPAKYAIRVTDALGEMVYQNQHNINKKLELNLNLKEGMYWLSVRNSSTGTTSIKKIIK